MFNEDAGAAGAGFVCTVDGATPLNSAPDANRATSRFAAAVVEAFAASQPGPSYLAAAVAGALAEAQHATGRRGVSATIAAAAWDGSTIATAVMGDSLIVLSGSPGVLVVQDPAFSGREARLLQPVVKALRAGTDPSEAYAAVLPVLSSERDKRNTEAGVWVLTDRASPEEVAGRISVRTFPKADFTGAASVTDGAWRGVELFEITDASGLLGHAAAGTVDTYFANLAAAEADDADRRRYPRFSLMDDATVAWSAMARRSYAGRYGPGM